MAAPHDLEEEQALLDQAHEGLDAMRREASRMLESVLDVGRGGTFQSRTERDIVVRTSLARLAQLDIGDQALCFGRIDRLPEPGPGDGPGEAESFHIGRLAVSGENHEPLVVDWRAPVAEPFYRATGLDPQGLARRRHLAVKGRTVVGLEDEYFAQVPNGAAAPAPAHNGAAAPVSANGTTGAAGAAGATGAVGLLDEGLALGGPGALLAALGEARTGHMGDIVATIQREQDEIIRSPLAGLLLVQGGPGTGKTAVALHRAAYLLYTHRFPLERQGVLVVGPNPLFLRYIEQVLPSLGETGVTLSTVAGLVPEIRVRATDAPDVALLKGEVRMTEFLARAVRTRQRALRRDVAVPFGGTTLRLTAADSASAVAQARRRSGTHNARRRVVETAVLRQLTEQYARFRRAMGLDDEGFDAAEVGRQLRRTPALAEALDRMWPRLAPHEFVHDLFGAKPLLAAAGEGILSPAEQVSLFRPRSPSLDAVAWTPADAALVDEARALLGPRRARGARARVSRRREGALWPGVLEAEPAPAAERAGAEDEGIREYGHIVVDEVQDLSPMQLRMLARRSLSGSMTVVGDIAQATGPWAPGSWEEIATHLAPHREPRRVELTVSYRTPAEVVGVAARVLEAAAPGIAPPRPVRRSGHEPRFVTLEGAGGDGVALPAARALARRVAQVAEEEVAAVPGGRTAILVPGTRYEELARALFELGIGAVDPRDPRGGGLASPLVLLPAEESNGLEFDAVVVVEPPVIAAGPSAGAAGAATIRGLRTLYVALTRPTRRLAVVSAGSLPGSLGGTAAGSGAG